MQDRFEIKPATIDDISVIYSFIKDSAMHHKLLHELILTENQLKEYLFGKNRYAEVIMAFLNDSPIGFALYFNNFPTFSGQPGIYVEDLYIIPEARGNGRGKKILAYLAKLVKKKNYGCLEWAVLDSNQTALQFYQRLGAKAKDKWTTYRLSETALDKLANSYSDSDNN